MKSKRCDICKKKIRLSPSQITKKLIAKGMSGKAIPIHPALQSITTLDLCCNCLNKKLKELGIKEIIR